MKKFLETIKNIKNHLVVGSFYFDLLTLDNTTQEHLNNFQEKVLGRFSNQTFLMLIRVPVYIFLKSSKETETFKFNNLFTDNNPLFVSNTKIKN